MQVSLFETSRPLPAYVATCAARWRTSASMQQYAVLEPSCIHAHTAALRNEHYLGMQHASVVKQPATADRIPLASMHIQWHCIRHRHEPTALVDVHRGGQLMTQMHQSLGAGPIGCELGHATENAVHTWFRRFGDWPSSVKCSPYESGSSRATLFCRAYASIT